jgi:hypothetical protein
MTVHLWGKVAFNNNFMDEGGDTLSPLPPFSQTYVQCMVLNHRCTVVGNPRGVLGIFWQILLRGVLGVVGKSL